jgi:hypothetical protein
MKNSTRDTAEEKPPHAELDVPRRAGDLDRLRGLSVELSDPCKCASSMAVISVGLHVSLRCASCQAKRGLLSRSTYEFIGRIITKFGPLTAPIIIRRGEMNSNNSGYDPECATGRSAGNRGVKYHA